MLILPLFGGSEIGCNCAEFQNPSKVVKGALHTGQLSEPPFRLLEARVPEHFLLTFKGIVNQDLHFVYNWGCMQGGNEVVEETTG